jgi:DNA-directed RNA polymerase specialized sigma24 family protein
MINQIEETVELVSVEERIKIMLSLEPLFKSIIKRKVLSPSLSAFREDILQDFYVKMLRHQDKLPQTKDEIGRWCRVSLVNMICTKLTKNSTQEDYYNLYKENVEDNFKVITKGEGYSLDIDPKGDINNKKYFNQLENIFILNVTDDILDAYYKQEEFQKKVILLRFIREEKLIDICKILSQPQHNIKNIIFGFRTDLREIVKQNM